MNIINGRWSSATNSSNEKIQRQEKNLLPRKKLGFVFEDSVETKTIRIIKTFFTFVSDVSLSIC